MPICSVTNNGICREGQVAIATAIHEESALMRLYGFELSEYRTELSVPSEMKYNEAILAYLRERRSSNRVKSAKGGTAQSSCASTRV
jgi:hypothetical protein